MDYRVLGKTGLRVSALGFGCGAVGGLFVAGDAREQERAVARAIEAGVNYFDTAQAYGQGRSEENLGRALRQRPERERAGVIVGTKVQLQAGDLERIAEAVTVAAEVSLRRLQVGRLDLFQLHNPVCVQHRPGRNWITLAEAEEAATALRALQARGKIRHWGINGLGDTEAVLDAIERTGAETVQIHYNLLNPSAGRAVAADFPFQDYGLALRRAADVNMGVIAIRVLAGGALAGTAERHPNALQVVDPIATSEVFADDVALARQFEYLVREGKARTLAEAAIRFAIAGPGVSTALVGISSLEQLEQAIAAAERGPLPADVIERLQVV
jgi:aryl-alcohol dehydrogenase-like predicted oxidoreductase